MDLGNFMVYRTVSNNAKGTLLAYERIYINGKMLSAEKNSKQKPIPKIIPGAAVEVVVGEGHRDARRSLVLHPDPAFGTHRYRAVLAQNMVGVGL